MENRRLMLLLVFSFSLIMLWDAWHKQNQPQPDTTTANTLQKQAEAHVPVPSASRKDAPSGALSEEIVGAKMTHEGEITTITTDLFVAGVSSQGGDIVSLELTAYKGTEDKNKKFLLFEPKHQYAAQSGLLGEGLPNHKTKFRVTPGKRRLESGESTLELRLDASPANGLRVSKIYTFTRGSYLIDLAYEIENEGQRAVAAHAYYQLQRDTEAPEGESSMVSTFTGPAIYTAEEKFQKVDFSDILKNKAKFTKTADNGWLAMIQHYFVSAWIIKEKSTREFYARKLEGGVKPAVAAGIIVPLPEVAPGSKQIYSTALFAGPQVQSILESLTRPAAEGGLAAEGLPLVVDYGWLTIVAAPIFWCLEVINRLVGNWGWSIVLLTIAIKLIFFPLSAASYRSMAKMRAVTPRITALRERCGDDKQKLNQEMMALYRAEKINPLGGCLPILVQIPVFIALYWALLGAVEMRDAPWILWIKDLSSQDPFYVLPVIMVVTMLIQTKLNPTPPDPIQAKITMIMPFVFGGMFFFFPSGLVLYWVVNNILSIAQQWQITRMIEAGGKAANDARA